jgi:myo-inositol-1(or 4)-monophosphatase
MTESLRRYLDFAAESAYLAGRLTLGYFQAGVRPDLKADSSLVTVADREAEALIRSRIERAYPQHGIVGEEYGETRAGDASHIWYIDPIDGTQSFVHGVPLYSVLLGLEIEGTAQVGVAYFPALEEMIMAASGEGCYWNGRRAQVSAVSSLAQAVVAFGNPQNFARYGWAAAWERLQQATAYCGGWGDAYGYFLVATGRAEVMLDPIMNAWDCAPFPPILREAGGYFGDWRGHWTIHGGEALATTAELLPQVLAALGTDR